MSLEQQDLDYRMEIDQNQKLWGIAKQMVDLVT